MANLKRNPRKSSTYKQKVSGTLDLKSVEEIQPGLRIKIAIARDCRIIWSQVLQIKREQREVKFNLEFAHEHPGAIGVRLLVGPDVPDEQLRSIEHQQRWLPARSFKEGALANLEVKIPARLYHCWLICCRTYTLRGRLVCRRLVWDPIEQTFVICDAPVRGARVTAYDVDCFWWWCRKDAVGSDFTDLNGNFEITFTWCCWWWRPWLFKTWQLDSDLVDKIRGLIRDVPFTVPLPHPDPVPDFSIFENLVTSARLASSQGQLLSASEEASSQDLVRLGQELVARLPKAPELEALHIWPWWPFFDCRPDIIFEATQDCGDGLKEVYSETKFQTRWNIGTVLDGVTLVANDSACCGPFCCSDPPDHDCLAIHGVGCGGYPVEKIEQDASDPLAGYAFPGNTDRPFGGTIRILGVFGDGSQVDYYKVQRRRITPLPTGWQDLPEGEVGSFVRGHWKGGIPPHIFETVKLQVVDGEKVLGSISRFRKEHSTGPNAVDPTVDPSNADRLLNWVTASGSLGNGAPMAGLSDGVYELRVIGYRYNDATKKLVDQQVMALCPPPGEDVDPGQQATLKLRLDNRVVSSVPGSIHLNTSEPDCDFPNICAIVKNEGTPEQECVDPCGFVRLSENDTLTIHFQATDSDGHLEAYQLTAHWAESDVFNVLSVGVLEGDPDPLYGPTYAHTFLGAQGLHRTVLPPTEPEHARPFWFGGHFKVTTTVGATVPSNPHKAFETCCAFLVRLRVWKRTTNGCTGSTYFHYNHCEFSFTVIREDLIGDPNHPSCSELCPPEPPGRGRGLGRG